MFLLFVLVLFVVGFELRLKASFLGKGSFDEHVKTSYYSIGLYFQSTEIPSKRRWQISKRCFVGVLKVLFCSFHRFDEGIKAVTAKSHDLPAGKTQYQQHI